MKLQNQEMVMPNLMQMAESRKHNVLISGSTGSGKSYLAKQYAKALHIPDFQTVETKMSSIKEAMDNCIGLQHPIVLCIENLDLGVLGVSYAILKFLEEPSEMVYLVITCRNIQQIPDTILSRVVTLELPAMAESDLLQYAKQKNPTQLAVLQKDQYLWKCVTSIKDIDTLFSMDTSQLLYFDSWKAIVQSNHAVSDIVWKFQKFPDGTSIPISIFVRYILHSGLSPSIFMICNTCLNAIENGKISVHAALTKLVFELKYRLEG